MEEEYNVIKARSAGKRVVETETERHQNAAFTLIAAREAAKHKHVHCVLMLVDKMKVMWAVWWCVCVDLSVTATRTCSKQAQAKMSTFTHSSCIHILMWQGAFLCNEKKLKVAMYLHMSCTCLCAQCLLCVRVWWCICEMHERLCLSEKSETNHQKWLKWIVTFSWNRKGA